MVAGGGAPSQKHYELGQTPPIEVVSAKSNRRKYYGIKQTPPE